ncbi:MAG: D-amino acid dehydrogenase small subunit [Oceanospirillaceae bacterium]|nr:D-amino acid dehydrogenase small subunit [Oceanospirillaceae bacterium]|tara:strand:+ start:3559 stop:4815 length:1257 start_codon:yes stop_codon:yes gene_type:complete
MTIAVLGGGIIGVSTAWNLAQSGHQVVIIDQQPTVAMETSFANAGMLSFGYASPWAAPGIPRKALTWMMQELSPVHIQPSEITVPTLSWLHRMWGQCNARAYDHNKHLLLGLAEYSRKCFVELRKKRRLEFDERQLGTIELFRDPQKMDDIEADLNALRDLGIETERLDRKSVLNVEPGLESAQNKFVGGLRFPNDNTGDCHRFAHELMRECRTLGVSFQGNTRIERLESDGKRIQSVITDQGTIQADTFVVAMGSYSPLLLQPLGIRLPVYPIKGYSMTLPIKNPEHAPRSTVMDEAYKVAITRFDDRIRVGGTAEVAGYNLDRPESRRHITEFVVSDLFPEGGDLDNAEFWTGLRPMTPDSLPVLGKTPFDNLFLNTGHGTLGWTLSQASGKLVSDIINERQTELDVTGLTLERYL